MKKTTSILLITSTSLLLILFLFSYLFKIETDYYCCESPTYRWKFAIYCGECDAETGCHFNKIEGTGVMEYFGLKEVDCPKNR